MRRARTPERTLALAVALAGLAAGACGHGRDYVWVEQLPRAAAADATYQIAPGDVIGIQVWNHQANSVERTRVREDGKISMPFLNDVEVGGSPPAALARRLEASLKEFLTNPLVTVVVHERRPVRVSVLGKVVRPGVYDLDPGSGVLHALAAAGDVTPFADQDRIFVLRNGSADGATARIRFRYSDLRAARAPAATFALRVSDVVVVE
jgi:polysaccharide export outer membrane protein